MSYTVAIDFNQPIPLFPLPNCVLLPHAAAPLRIFEPRYRAMTRDALAGDRLVAMASFEGDQWKQDYLGAPPLRPHVCVGQIIRETKLPDGCYHLLMQGVCRGRIIEETTSAEYRSAIIEPTETDPPMEIDIEDRRRRLESLLNDEGLKELASVSAILNWMNGDIPTVVLVDLAVMALCDDVEDRYAMLAEPDTVTRAKWIEQWLSRTRRTLTAANRFGPAVSADGLMLN